MVKKNRLTRTQLIKEQLGWNSFDECKEGFWLDAYTFIKAENSSLKMVNRATSGFSLEKLETAPMLILTDVVEMLVDKNGKILGLERIKKFGLWLDALGRIFEKNILKKPKNQDEHIPLRSREQRAVDNL